MKQKITILHILYFRPSITFPDHFYCPSTEKEAIFTMQRDIPNFDKYVLSEQTKESLKTPDFDIWQWEPNEVSSIMIPKL